MNAYFKRCLDMAAKEGVTEYKFVRDGAAFPGKAAKRVRRKAAKQKRKSLECGKHASAIHAHILLL